MRDRDIEALVLRIIRGEIQGQMENVLRDLSRENPAIGEAILRLQEELRSAGGPTVH